MHPLVGDLSRFNTSEIEHKIADLNKKYVMCQNSALQQQISLLLTSYNEEIYRRRQEELERVMSSKNIEFNNIINIE